LAQAYSLAQALCSDIVLPGICPAFHIVKAFSSSTPVVSSV